MTLFELAAVLTLDKSAFEKGISEAESSAGGFGSKLSSGIAGGVKAATAALTASTGAVISFSKSSVEAGMTFDTSMAQVAATMGVTVDEIDELRDFAQEMGATTAFSAGQSADALNYMALAGYDAEQAMEMLPTVLNLAAAGGIELAYASDMITDSQSALGLSFEETTELVDKMAQAASKSNTSVEQLGEAILTIGGTAKNLAGGTTELSTALGILADNGIKGAEGGTHLRNVILSLSAPTDTAAAALEELGVEVFDAAGNMRPLNDVLGDFNDATSEMTQGEKTQLISTIFNKTDISAVNALLANTGDRWDELTGYIDDAAGAAENMADTQLDTLAGDITLFQSALEGAQIKVSDGLTPSIREFVQFATNGIGTITDAFDEGGLQGAFGAIGTVFSEAITMIVEMLPEFVAAGRMLLENLIYGIIESAPTIVQAFADILNDVFDALPDFFATLSDLIPKAIKDIIPIIKTNVPKIIKGITDGFAALADSIDVILPDLADAAIAIVESLAEGITDNIDTLINAVVSIVLTIAEQLTRPDLLVSLVTAALDIALALVDGLIAAIPTIIEALPVIIQNICDALVELLPLIIDAGIQLFTSLVAALPTIIASICEVLPQIIFSTTTALLEMLPTIIEAGITLFVSLIDALPTIIEGICSQLPSLIVGIVTGLLSNIDKIVMAGVELLIALVSNTPQIIIGICKAVPAIISGIVNAFSDQQGQIVEVGTNLISGLWEGIQNMGSWIKDKVSGFFTGIVDGVKDLLGIHSPSTVFSDMGGNIVSGVWEGIQNMGSWIQDKVSGFFGGIVDNVKDLLGIHSPSTVFAEMGENMALGVGKGFDSEFDDIRKDINDQMDFTANADLNVNRGDVSYSDYQAAGAAMPTNSGTNGTEKQPLIVIVQMASGVEVGRQYIADITEAMRADGIKF